MHTLLLLDVWFTIKGLIVIHIGFSVLAAQLVADNSSVSGKLDPRRM